MVKKVNESYDKVISHALRSKTSTKKKHCIYLQESVVNVALLLLRLRFTARE